MSAEGVVEILGKLEKHDLFSLAKTVTQGLMKFNTAEDAVEAVIKHSPDAANVLRRKIITKELLFNYLSEKNVKIQLPASKNDLIDKVIEFWNQNNLTLNVVSSGAVEDFANQFTTWFYTMLNNGEVESNHFYPDSKLTINIISGDNTECHVTENDPVEISRQLYLLRTMHNLTFNPNLTSEGVKGKEDPHGLVAVIICGTLHNHHCCVGVFEQIFFLARDPTCDNNWKIKSSEINLKNQNVQAVPVLTESQFNM